MNTIFTIENQQSISLPEFVLSLIQISNQAVLLHWQAKFYNEHIILGQFYDSFNDLMDSLVESIIGKCGDDCMSFDQANIVVYDYSRSREKFFELIEDCLGTVFPTIFNESTDSELYSIVDDILVLTNRTKYLLNLR